MPQTPHVIAKSNSKRNESSELQFHLEFEDRKESSKKASMPTTKVQPDVDNTPPFSRLFVVCGKESSEEDINKHFSPYGEIEYCKLIRDKFSNDSKGICYIKYTTASSAALAVEKTDGSVINENDSVSLKVQIAEAKGSNKKSKKQYSSEPEDTPARSRLFVVCPKELTESALHETFSKFPELEYCKVIIDKQTGDSKGFAYVKYRKASSAALAMESISEISYINDMKVKILIADPKNKRQNDVNSVNTNGEVFYGNQVPQYSTNYLPIHPYYMNFVYHYPMPERITLTCHSSVTQYELSHLLSAFPGMNQCDLVLDQFGESKGYAYVYFANQQAALYACEQLEHMEFPSGSGWKIHCVSSETLSPSSSSPTNIPYLSPPNAAYYLSPPNNYTPSGPQFMSPPNDTRFYASYQPSIPYTQTEFLRFTCDENTNEQEIYNVFVNFGNIDIIQLDDEKSGVLLFSNPSSTYHALTVMEHSGLENVASLQVDPNYSM